MLLSVFSIAVTGHTVSFSFILMLAFLMTAPLFPDLCFCSLQVFRGVIAGKDNQKRGQSSGGYRPGLVRMFFFSLFFLASVRKQGF
jgi:hypothetical protein